MGGRSSGRPAPTHRPQLPVPAPVAHPSRCSVLKYSGWAERKRSGPMTHAAQAHTTRLSQCALGQAFVFPTAPILEHFPLG